MAQSRYKIFKNQKHTSMFDKKFLNEYDDYFENLKFEHNLKYDKANTGGKLNPNFENSNNLAATTPSPGLFSLQNVMKTNQNSEEKNPPILFNKNIYEYSDGSVYIGYISKIPFNPSIFPTHRSDKKNKNNVNIFTINTKKKEISKEDKGTLTTKTKENKEEKLGKINILDSPNNKFNLENSLIKAKKLQRNGPGIMIWPNGSIYEGYWLLDLFHLKGIYYDSKGNIFEGNWFHGNLTGNGRFYGREGNIYEGEFRNNLQHGKGKEDWRDGSVYHGEFFNGKKQGEGNFMFRNGNLTIKI